MKVETLALPRFDRAYERLSPKLQNMATQSFREFRGSYGKSPRLEMGRHASVKGLSATLPPILELELGGGPRLLVACDGKRLVLADVGMHEVVSEFTKSAPRAWESSAAGEPPRAFLPGFRSELFVNDARANANNIPNQSNAHWLYQLDDQQAAAVDRMEEQWLEVSETPGHPASTIVVGGPGTGKTAILLNTLKVFVEEWKLQVRLSISPAVRDYVASALSINLSRHVIEDFEARSGDVLLVDDPRNVFEINAAMGAAKQGAYRLVVVAFDPLQLMDDMADKDLAKIRRTNKCQVIKLDTCYRQRATVGERTKAVVEAVSNSTPFLASRKKELWWKQHKIVTSSSNAFRMTNPGGYSQVYDPARVEDLAAEVARIRTERLWQHWDPVVLFIDDNASEPAALAKVLRQELNRHSIGTREVVLSEVESVKGTEFQHGFILLGGNTFDQIERGFEGSGQAVYRERRRLRIPFSRPKDSLVTLVCR